MIRATLADRPQIETFLRAHIATSMFPLTNLINHGMSGGHPRAVSFWMNWQAGQIADVLGLTDEGLIFPQCPTAAWGDIAAVMHQTKVKGLLGEASQVQGLRNALGITTLAALDTVEPLYQMTLSQMTMPDCDECDLRPLSDAHLQMIENWRARYCMESLAVPAATAKAQARRDVAGYLTRDSHRVLFSDGVPVCMTGFNAELPDTVQIGGVYTPPALRCRGYARKAVALHLAQARGQGAETAVLFAANAAAEKAYRAIGFHQTGQYAMAIYGSHQVAHG
ncbi:GNAT family N-acetyltransferase [Yoonia sediminilitoris]|uniref:Putative GNAT family acetyltransferase n=1 Tax=Yoonia sediminilitoris TaxID=1286148 RepID=A0A2T6KIH7_9RHOB|nr:GNAT family N-acetyltransferase [Yoonia sediminilitoris]PUB15461.1 putative GNAT family acetyltransferase [Yoonia sediminilitoris]RCW96071.1 putative GNAT family acetyltransferase [Yoonia sediminilitoris]